MAKTSVSSKKTKKSDNTLSCSFCGKTQHQVRKLIAAPSVYICDECVELCDDIIINETKGDLFIKIKTNRGEYSELLVDTIVEAVAEKHPDLGINFEWGRSNWESNSHILLTTKQGAFDDMDPEDVELLRKEIGNLTTQIANATQKFLTESKKRKKLEQEISELKSEYLDYIRQNFTRRDESLDLKAVMFMDIKGFSKLSEEVKDELLNMVRGIVNPLIKERGASEINTWGDAIVCTFEDHEKAIQVSWRFLKHLSVEQFEGRVGLAWGEVRTKHNKAIDRLDIEGSVVDLAARLEPLAPIGKILCSESFGGLEYKNIDVELIPHVVEVKKSFAEFREGDTLHTYLADLNRN